MLTIIAASSRKPTHHRRARRSVAVVEHEDTWFGSTSTADIAEYPTGKMHYNLLRSVGLCMEFDDFASNLKKFPWYKTAFYNLFNEIYCIPHRYVQGCDMPETDYEIGKHYNYATINITFKHGNEILQKSLWFYYSLNTKMKGAIQYAKPICLKAKENIKRTISEIKGLVNDMSNAYNIFNDINKSTDQKILENKKAIEDLKEKAKKTNNDIIASEVNINNIKQTRLNNMKDINDIDSVIATCDQTIESARIRIQQHSDKIEKSSEEIKSEIAQEIAYVNDRGAKLKKIYFGGKSETEPHVEQAIEAAKKGDNALCNTNSRYIMTSDENY